MTQRIVGITIGIAVKDVAEATKWYKSLLGDVETMEPAPGTIELKLTDDSWLQLDDTGYLAPGGESSIIRLEAKDIESAHKQAKELDPKAGDIETVEGVIRFFDFKDPAGNRLSYVELM
jgi:lactoylglutathione lyase